MDFESRFDIFALFMLIGVSQGILLGYYFLRKDNRRDRSKMFFGLFLVTSVILASEILLNYSGIIVKVIFIENYSEPFIFLLTPLLYMIIKSRLNEPFSHEDYIHYVPFGFYFLYTFLYFMQSPEFKYNSFVYCYHPDWTRLPVNMILPDDPLGLRTSLAPLYITQSFIYLNLIFIKLKYYPSQIRFRLFAKKDPIISPLFGYWVHAVALTIFILFVKLTFDRDLGDYLVGTYISIMLYVSSFIVVSRHLNVYQPSNEEEVRSKPKYEKSSLDERKKDEILQKIVALLEGEKYFTRNMISLTDIARAVNEAPHHVSQVINERTGKNFFDLLSTYRINEAKILLTDKVNHQYTIEEIAERVGYNSKAAFNKAFKTLTGQTPSEFKKCI